MLERVPNSQSHFVRFVFQADIHRDVCDSCIEFSNFIRGNFADALNWRIWTFRGSKNAITP